MSTSDSSRQTRYVIVDSSVLLHDPLVVTRFATQSVVIAAGCLHTLQSIGSQTTELARNARQAAHLIESSIDVNATNEMTVAVGHVFIDTRFNAKSIVCAGMNSTSGPHDDGTLSLAAHLIQHHGVDSTSLLSRDAAVRALGLANHVRCYPYELHSWQDAEVDSGLIAIDDAIANQLNTTSSDHPVPIERKRLGPTHRLQVGQILIHETTQQALAIVVGEDSDSVLIRPLTGAPHEDGLWGIQARNQQQAAALGALCDADIDLVSIHGDAGTGKTLLALAAGLHLVFDRELYQEVLITRATVSVGDEIGFLPGNEEEKMHPWMGAIEDSLDLLLPNASDQAGRFGKSSSHDLIRRRIKVRSMSFMRGRTFTNKYVIIDEAQNLTAHEMRMMITRAGQGTKVICLGNMQQIDTPWISAETSGLTWLHQHFQGWPHSARIVLAQVERSRLADKASAGVDRLSTKTL